MKQRISNNRIRVFVLMAAALLVATGVAAVDNKRGGCGKNIVVMGDSNTWLGGDNCDKPAGWTKWFKDIVKPASCRSYARSGATWTNTVNTKRDVEENIGVLGDDNVVYNQVCRLALDIKNNRIGSPDIIIISAGTNDVWFKDKRPGALSDGSLTAEHAARLADAQPGAVLTLAESVAQNCVLLRRLCPDAAILLLTPMQTTQASAADIAAAGDIIERCADVMELGVVRLDRLSPVKRNTEQRRRAYTTDGTHTNQAGAKLNGRIVAEAVLDLNRH